MLLDSHPYILLLTSDETLSQLIRGILEEMGHYYQHGRQLNDLKPEYCLVIAGPDMKSSMVESRLSEFPGIPPRLLYLKGADSGRLTGRVRCCKCMTLQMPMDVFKIRESIDRMMQVEFGESVV